MPTLTHDRGVKNITKVHRLNFRLSMPYVIGMAFENGKGAVELLQQHYPRQFVRQRHPAQRKYQRRRLPCLIRESIGRTHRKQQRERVSLVIVPQKFCQFLGGKLLSPSVQEHQRVAGQPRVAGAKLQKSLFVLERKPFHLGVAHQAFQILIRQRLDGRFFGLPDPGNFELHGRNLITEEAGKRSPIRPVPAATRLSSSSDHGRERVSGGDLRLPILPAPGAGPTSTTFPDRRTSALFPKKCGQRNPHSPATPTLPACTPRFDLAASRSAPGAPPLHPSWLALALDWCPCPPRNRGGVA